MTAGNSSQISDGAAAVVVASEAIAKQHDSPIKARIVATATSGVAPKELFIAPVSAIEKVLAKAKLKLADIDLVELNEAFAAQCLACMRPLGLDPAKTNIHGGAIALGHPIGASGARVLVTLLYALQKKNLRRGLAALCLGGGNAVAMIVERDSSKLARPFAAAGQQSGGQMSGAGPSLPSVGRSELPLIRSSINSRIIWTKRGCVPTVAARIMFRPSPSAVCLASVSRS